MMFAQANPEHCRHKIFTRDWIIDGVASAPSRCSPWRSAETRTAKNSRGVLSALSRQRGRDRRPRSAVVAPADEIQHTYAFIPTSPSTILDEGGDYTTIRTGHLAAISLARRRARAVSIRVTKARPVARQSSAAGLAGFSVSHLRIPGFEQPWKKISASRVARCVGARHHGRRSVSEARRVQHTNSGVAPTFSVTSARSRCSKPQPTCPDARAPRCAVISNASIMIAGGVGNVRRRSTWRSRISARREDRRVLGGPAMLIAVSAWRALRSRPPAAARASTGRSLISRPEQRVATRKSQRRAQSHLDQCWAIGQ